MGGVKGLFSGKGGAESRNINPSQMNRMQQQLTRAIDPRILNQMGGLNGLQNMMKQFQGGAGGLGGMLGNFGKPWVLKLRSFFFWYTNYFPFLFILMFYVELIFFALINFGNYSFKIFY